MLFWFQDQPNVPLIPQIPNVKYLHYFNILTLGLLVKNELFVNVCLNVIFYMFVNIQIFPFNFMPQTVPQQPPVVRQLRFEPLWVHSHCYWNLLKDWILSFDCNFTQNPPFQDSPPQSLEPQQQAQPEQHAQTGQVCVGLNEYVWEAKNTTLSKALIWQHNYSFSAAFSIQQQFCRNSMHATHLLIILPFFRCLTSREDWWDTA